jgi:hypothetical protein
VGIHPRDVAPVRVSQPEVERGRDVALGVVQDLEPRVSARGGVQELAASVGRAAVDEQDLHVAVQPLAADAVQDVRQDGALVEDRYEHAHDGARGRGRSHGPIVAFGGAPVPYTDGQLISRRRRVRADIDRIW